MRIFHHFQKIRIQIWLALEIKDEVEKFFINLVNRFFEKNLFSACRLVV